MQRLSVVRLAIALSHGQPLGGLPSLAARGMHSSLVSLQQGPSGGSDPFTQQLQQKTERELADLLAAAQARKEGASGAAPSGTSDADEEEIPKDQQPAQPDEIGGPKGKEPTRYGDWERGGKCIDF